MIALDVPADDDVPARQPDVQWVELDGEAVLHDPRTGRLHLLNASATSVWATCDGSATLARIIMVMQEAYAGIGDGIALDVRAVLTRLMRDGLVVLLRRDQSSAETPPPSSNSASDDGRAATSPAD